MTFSLYGRVRGLFQLSILQPLLAGLIILIIAPFLSNSFSCLCDYKHSHLLDSSETILLLYFLSPLWLRALARVTDCKSQASTSSLWFPNFSRLVDFQLIFNFQTYLRNNCHWSNLPLVSGLRFFPNILPSLLHLLTGFSSLIDVELFQAAWCQSRWMWSLTNGWQSVLCLTESISWRERIQSGIHAVPRFQASSKNRLFASFCCPSTTPLSFFLLSKNLLLCSLLSQHCNATTFKRQKEKSRLNEDSRRNVRTRRQSFCINCKGKTVPVPLILNFNELEIYSTTPSHNADKTLPTILALSLRRPFLNLWFVIPLICHFYYTGKIFGE